MLEANDVQSFCLKTFQKNKYVLCHLQFSRYLKTFDQVENCPYLFLVRDLRDVCVSAVFYIDKQWPGTFAPDLGKNPSFDQKLMWVITQGFGKRQDHWANFAFHAREVLSWRNKPNAHFFYFEDLCGSMGGGSYESQQESIQRLSNILDVDLSPMDIDYICNHLYGPATTSNAKKNTQLNFSFREGKTGSWRKFFKDKHIAAFKKHLGEELILLGYEENNDW